MHNLKNKMPGSIALKSLGVCPSTVNALKFQKLFFFSSQIKCCPLTVYIVDLESFTRILLMGIEIKTYL